MPLVRLTGTYDRRALERAAEIVHDAMVAHLRVPPDDVFRVLASAGEREIVADSGYLAIARERPLFIEITLRRGRSDDVKRAFYESVAEGIAAAAVARAEDVLIVLRENEAIDWSFGNGIAQNAPSVESRV